MVDKTRLKIVGLTGGIGSGKSTIAELFMALNIKVIDSDQITRDLVAPNQEAFQSIVNHFGKEILNSDGHLNRQKLKIQIFNSMLDRIWLEGLLHPLAKKEILDLKEQVPSNEYQIVEIPLLFETHFEAAVDRILVVDCAEKEQIARVAKRDDLSETTIEAIMQTQVSRRLRLSQADDIIVNTGKKGDLQSQVFALHQKYQRLAINC
jgi:dephospho-CoA kinase